MQYINRAQKSMDVCVFTITNNRLASAVNAAHQRGVQVRVISDDECMKHKGSDVHWLHEKGIPVRTDLNEATHMHNKFLIIDRTHVLTGSFNWTS